MPDTACAPCPVSLLPGPFLGRAWPSRPRDLVAGNRQQVFGFLFHPVAAYVDAMVLQVGTNPADYIVDTDFLEIGVDNRPGIGIGLRFVELHLLGSPQSQQPC